MKFFKYLICLIFLGSSSLFAQIENPVHQFSKDSSSVSEFSGDPDWKIIKEFDGTFLKEHKVGQKIDSLWLAELTNSDLYPKIKESVLNIPYNTDEVALADVQNLSKEQLVRELASLNLKSGFYISYRPELANTIEQYLSHRKKSFERLMSLGYYYFPLFEEKLDKYNLPLELKYLPIVESALNPKAKSRVGATGLWQFMFATGKMHNLEVSNYLDDRMDPEKSTEAAAQYLSELYKIFGDWNLVLAAYNAGPGNVSKAIRRSGETDFWKLKDYLPRETANYVPAFLATYYIFEHAHQLGFEPYQPETIRFNTDTIQVKHPVKFDYIAKTLGVDKDLIGFLNPQYKLNIVPASKEHAATLRLPVEGVGLFAANEELIYKQSQEIITKEGAPQYQVAQSRLNYKVKSGDYLGKIAQKYGVSIANLRKWNRLANNNIRIGQNLVIYPKSPQVVMATPKTLPTSKNSGNSFYVVRKGDSIWSISQKIKGVTVAQIKKWNGISGDNLKPGMKLKVAAQ